ncbi:uncharacterized protein Gasu_04900 [Galdieria sulphuraria]|uniref:Uncharacterized protein n=1 Tax=Galdieria sulphuraria TaxID=130081 RepID=M2Y8M1_GALSU|nr:uncharacterized protein Gasu_04900 [Galdieria sulphuraria]EME32403.1 hypothetical protein Gasu_04900 [Galdieria sulphuraria]|eukprot:XP_005708923.1 hypothetical protein Gasu_04900 [Galdieria sulphuraria]
MPWWRCCAFNSKLRRLSQFYIVRELRSSCGNLCREEFFLVNSSKCLFVDKNQKTEGYTQELKVARPEEDDYSKIDSSRPVDYVLDAFRSAIDAAQKAVQSNPLDGPDSVNKQRSQAEEKKDDARNLSSSRISQSNYGVESSISTSSSSEDDILLQLDLNKLNKIGLSPWKVLDDFSQQLETVEAPNPEKTPRLAEPLRRVLQEDGVVRVEELQENTQEGLDLSSKEEGDVLDRSSFIVENFFKYIPASKDHKLQRLAKNFNLRYTGSTSSVVPVLSSIYHVLSRYRRTSIDGLSGDFRNSTTAFTRYMLKPVTIILYPGGNGLYNIDKAEEKPPKVGVLSDIGHLLEKLFTQENMSVKKRIDFSSINIPNVQDSGSEERPYHNAEYRFAKFGNCLFRAQVDCYDPSTEKFFDVKTRALAAIRYQIERYEDYLEKEITKTTGYEDSFERELYDMIRSVFIKYALQFRIGGMSGAFVSFHSIGKVSGYQYIPLEEIEKYVFGNEAWAGKSFCSSMKIFEDLLDNMTHCFPGEDPIRVTIDPFSHTGVLNVYVARLREGAATLEWRNIQEFAFNKKVEESLKILPNDIKKFQVHIATFVNALYSGAPVNYTKNDQLHLLYSIREIPVCLNDYIKALRLSLGLEDMPQSRHFSVSGLSSTELADILASTSFQAFHLIK